MKQNMTTHTNHSCWHQCLRLCGRKPWYPEKTTCLTCFIESFALLKKTYLFNKSVKYKSIR